MSICIIIDTFKYDDFIKKPENRKRSGDVMRFMTPL